MKETARHEHARTDLTTAEHQEEGRRWCQTPTCGWGSAPSPSWRKTRSCPATTCRTADCPSCTAQRRYASCPSNASLFILLYPAVLTHFLYSYSAPLLELGSPVSAVQPSADIWGDFTSAGSKYTLYLCIYFIVSVPAHLISWSPLITLVSAPHSSNQDAAKSGWVQFSWAVRNKRPLSGSSHSFGQDDCRHKETSKQRQLCGDFSFLAEFSLSWYRTALWPTLSNGTNVKVDISTALLSLSLLCSSLLFKAREKLSRHTNHVRHLFTAF